MAYRPTREDLEGYHESFERTGRPIMSKTLRARPSKKTPLKENVFTLNGLLRLTSKDDAVGLSKVVGEALAPLGVDGIVRKKLPGEMNISIASAWLTHSIFLRKVTRPTPENVRSFNRATGRAANIINKAHQPVFVQLGEICIFGPEGNEAGLRHVGPTIEPDSREVLAEEMRLYLDSVIPDADQSVKKKIEGLYDPHLTVAVTGSEVTAQRIMNTLHEANISGAWVGLNAVKNPPTMPTRF